MSLLFRRVAGRCFPFLFLVILTACGDGRQVSSDGSSTATLPERLSAQTDVVQSFAGVRNSYTITKTTSGYLVTDNVGGVVTASGATALQFADVRINLLVADNAKTISATNLQSLIELYVAFFNRVPDADGLNYWIDTLRGGTSLDLISESFYQAAIQFTTQTGYSATMSNADFVRIIYKNVLGRTGATAPPDADVNYWANLLTTGVSTKGNLVRTMLSSAHTFVGDATFGWVPQLLDNKIAVATFFSIQQGVNYLSSQDQVTRGMAIAAAVTPTDTAAARTAIGISDTQFNMSSLVPGMNSVAGRAPVALSNIIVVDQNTSVPKPPPVPAFAAASLAGFNFKVWTYDPRDTTVTLKSSGVFISKDSGSFVFNAANSNGTLGLQLAAGSYLVDVLEASGTTASFTRKRYTVTVAANGVVTVKDVAADANGIFALTVTPVAVVSAAVQARRDSLVARAKQNAADFVPTSSCQLLDQVTPVRTVTTKGLSAGFPKVSVRLPSYGRIRALIVPVDFPDVVGVDNPPLYYKQVANDVRDFYLATSFGRVTFDFEILPSWVRMPFSVSDFGYGATVGSGNPDQYLKSVLARMDPVFNFDQYDVVYFLVPQSMPQAKMGWGPAFTSEYDTKDGYINNGVTGGADMYTTENNGVVGGHWKWMAHETGHIFGLYDEDQDHVSQTLGSWGIMAFNWSNDAIEHNGWDRFLQGWLSDSQFTCLSRAKLASASSTVVLNPIERQNAEVKVAMMPLSSAKMLVVESRKSEGFDKLQSANEGVLVYTVDMTLGHLNGGYKTIRRPGSTDSFFKDAALHAGDSVNVEGVIVTVKSTGSSGDTVIFSGK
jgi:M6 family metalloprotease-like protein